MSDWRTAAEAELLLLVAGTDNCGVAEVCGSASLNDLVQRDSGGNLPAIGTSYVGHERYEDDELGASHRHVVADFEVYVVARGGSRQDAKVDLGQILGRIDTRLDGARSALPPLWSWEVSAEQIDEYENDNVSAIMRASLVITKDTN